MIDASEEISENPSLVIAPGLSRLAQVPRSGLVAQAMDGTDSEIHQGA